MLCVFLKFLENMLLLFKRSRKISCGWPRRIKKRIPLIALENVCMPRKKGGFGLRRVTSMNDLLLAKLLWRWHKEDGEWKNIWNDKYNFDNSDFYHFLNNNVD